MYYSSRITIFKFLPLLKKQTKILVFSFKKLTAKLLLILLFEAPPQSGLPLSFWHYWP